MKVGDSVPNSSFAMTDGQTHTFADFAGKNVVLYFYPKDDTPGCTLEAQGFPPAVQWALEGRRKFLLDGGCLQAGPLRALALVNCSAIAPQLQRSCTAPWAVVPRRAGIRSGASPEGI